MDIQELTPEILEILFIEGSISDKRIAELFNVKSSKITYLRKKHGISIRNSIIDDFLKQTPPEINHSVKEELFIDENISKIAKALTHFAFRNGPIEDMHADPNKHITDEDMKVLNKYMVNRLAYIVILIKEERWFELDFLVREVDYMFGHHWDPAEADDGGMGKLIRDRLNNYRN